MDQDPTDPSQPSRVGIRAHAALADEVARGARAAGGRVVDPDGEIDVLLGVCATDEDLLDWAVELAERELPGTAVMAGSSDGTTLALAGLGLLPLWEATGPADSHRAATAGLLAARGLSAPSWTGWSTAVDLLALAGCTPDPALRLLRLADAAGRTLHMPDLAPGLRPLTDGMLDLEDVRALLARLARRRRLQDQPTPTGRSLAQEAALSRSTRVRGWHRPVPRAPWIAVRGSLGEGLAPALPARSGPAVLRDPHPGDIVVLTGATAEEAADLPHDVLLLSDRPVGRPAIRLRRGALDTVCPGDHLTFDPDRGRLERAPARSDRMARVA